MIKTSVSLSKLIPPFPGTGTQSGEKFQSLYKQILNSKVTIVCTPPGYGKTTLLSCFFSQHNLSEHENGSTIKCSWLSIDGEDSEPLSFISSLANCLDKALPGFLDLYSKELSGCSDSEPVSHALDILIQGLQGLKNKDTYFCILDDYHHVADGQTINSIMDTVLKKSPENFRFCIASRVRLPLSLRMAAFNYSFIGKEDLSFSLAEGWLLLSQIKEAKVSYSQYQNIHKITEGWPAGLVISGHALAKDDSVSTKRIELKDHDYFFEFFTEEVFKKQSGLKDFLIKASILEKCTVLACREILNEEQAEQLLEAAISQGMLISLYYSEEKEYRFHQLFKDYLLKNLAGLAPDAINALHLKAADYYVKTDDSRLALYHLIKAGKNNRVFAFLSEEGQALVYKDIFPFFKSWLSKLPEEYKKSKPELYYFEGYMYQYENPYIAIDCLRKAAEIIPPENIEYKIRSMIVLSIVFGMQNRFDMAEQIVNNILTITDSDLNNAFYQKAGIIMRLLMSVWLDRLDLIDKLIEDLRDLPQDVETEFVALLCEGVLCYRKGDLTKADYILRRLICKSFVSENPLWKGMVFLYHLHILQSLRAREEALQEIKYLYELGDNFGWPFYTAFADWMQGKFLYIDGNYGEAMACFKRASAVFNQLTNRAMEAVMEAEITLVMSKTGTGYGNQAKLESSRSLNKLKGMISGLWLENYVASISGVIALNSGDFQLAEEVLSAVVLENRTKEAQHLLAGNLLNLSYLYYLLGDDERATTTLAEGLKIASFNGYNFFSDWNSEAVENCCFRALQQSLCPDYVRELLLSGFDRKTADKLIILSHNNPKLKKRIIDLAGQIYSKDSGILRPPSLFIRILGEFQIVIDGREMTDKIWETKKTRELFKFLILQDGKKVARESLQDSLWPENPDPSVSLRVTLTRLRKAIGHIGREDILKDEDGFLWLETANCIIDFKVFKDKAWEGSRAIVEGAIGKARELLLSAVNLYEGDISDSLDSSGEWLEVKREELRLIYIEAVISLTNILLEETTGKTARTELLAARDVLHNAIQKNPFAEEFYYRLCSVYHRLGQPDSASNIYRQCKKMLLREFGIIPDERWNKMTQ